MLGCAFCAQKLSGVTCVSSREEDSSNSLNSATLTRTDDVCIRNSIIQCYVVRKPLFVIVVVVDNERFSNGLDVGLGGKRNVLRDR